MGYAKTSLVKQSARTASSAAPQASNPAGAAGKDAKTSVWNVQIGGKRQRTAMSRVEVLLFTSELADLIEAGMTLGQALQALAGQGEEDSAQRYIGQDLCDRIIRGESFSDACAHHPKTFPPLYSNMIRAGEASGAMVEVLRRLVDH
ncbi:MAG: type II secretion system F family protein, partial [Clostridia bacterium]|nr:type II secretion system F family protein [Clostridia bacterium]